MRPDEKPLNNFMGEKLDPNKTENYFEFKTLDVKTDRPPERRK